MGVIKKTLGVGAGYAIGGIGGAFVGGALAGGGGDDPGYDMSDIPFGVHVEEEHEDDEEGRTYTLRFLSELPTRAHAHLAFVTDDGIRVRGRAPHATEDGSFGVLAAIEDRQCVVVVPWASLQYASPKNISMEVSLWEERNGSAVPKGKAILDASLPDRR